MKSISIHKIEDKLMALIQRKADEKGLSLNKTIKLLLREALGMGSEPESNKMERFEEFSGIWTEDEFQSFEAGVKDFSQIDQEDWA